MAQDRPTADELLEALGEFLEEKVFPKVEGATQFHTRVAMNVVKILRRELADAPVFDAAERGRLQRLLLSDEADLTKLNEALCKEIQSGSFDERRSELIDHLKATVQNKLEIANPKYLGE
ncbi:MAG: hypothetical protein KDH09_10180 [Chrysiogenetes bacterium]|nr:hypothetical protein [Chrysiogenetes bacterium]